MKIYIVVYGDWDCYYDIKGVFTNEVKAKKCEEYEQILINDKNKIDGGYGRCVGIVEMDCCDGEDFDAKIEQFNEMKRKEKQAEEDAIREKDLEEFNRIKEKYNLKS